MVGRTLRQRHPRDLRVEVVEDGQVAHHTALREELVDGDHPVGGILHPDYHLEDLQEDLQGDLRADPQVEDHPAGRQDCQEGHRVGPLLDPQMVLAEDHKGHPSGRPVAAVVDRPVDHQEAMVVVRTTLTVEVIMTGLLMPWKPWHEVLSTRLRLWLDKSN